MLEASARAHPVAPALAGSAGRSPTGSSWRGRTLLGGPGGLGIAKGDRVGLVMPNCPQYVIAFYATARLGAIVVGNNPLYTEREMEHQLRDSDPKVVVVLDLLHSDFASVFETVGTPTWWFRAA
jgi:acyl-CoA synthetase (AMP-forming)/AMP-acid ligase II